MLPAAPCCPGIRAPWGPPVLLGLICFSHSGQSAVPVLDAMTPLVEAERDVKWEARLVWQVLPFKKEGAVAGEGSCDGLISAALIGAMRWVVITWAGENPQLPRAFFQFLSLLTSQP